MRDNDDFDIPWSGLVAAVSAIGLATFLLAGWWFVTYSSWAPQLESARRESFERSPSYVRGKQQYLMRLYGEWAIADGGHRVAICAVAQSEAAAIRHEDVPTKIKEWECLK